MGEDPVVMLNVSGVIMSAKRSTLCQIEDSLLTVMLSERSLSYI
jgi:hypothetical protein